MKLLISTLLVCTILLSGCSQTANSDNLESLTSTISSSSDDTSSDDELEFITLESGIEALILDFEDGTVGLVEKTENGIKISYHVNSATYFNAENFKTTADRFSTHAKEYSAKYGFKLENFMVGYLENEESQYAITNHDDEQFKFVNFIDGTIDYYPYITSEQEITKTDDTPPTKTDKAVKIPQGMYKVGSEILAGEYLIIPESSDRSSYVEVSADSSGKSIVTNENVKTFFFVSVLDGQYLTVKNGTLTNTAELGSLGDILDFSDGYHQGHYRVGIDMPAGEYKITPYEGASTYYEVSKDSFGKSIITNDNIKAQSYITVSDGQYLKFSRAVATKVD